MAKRSQEIRDFILANVEENPRTIVRMAVEHFGISRQAIHRHMDGLYVEGKIIKTGIQSGSQYFLVKTDQASVFTESFVIDLTQPQDEHLIWKERIKPRIQHFPSNIVTLWSHCVTEMINNAIDHSNGTELKIILFPLPDETGLVIEDNGVGIFNKIQREKNFPDPLTAMLELQKGKLTTAREGHAGEGIFFTSRICDSFAIKSEQILFTHHDGYNPDGFQETSSYQSGTLVVMRIQNTTTKEIRDIFERYEDKEQGFAKTEVSVKLICDDGAAMSRSQAKRLLARIEHFKSVILDFTDVREIGQGFADEIFRVFWNEHPMLKIVPVHANENVSRMIQHAILTKDPD